MTNDNNNNGSAFAHRALLPEGFRDGLQPDAEREASVVSGLMDQLASFGYQRVSPPMVEFERSLTGGLGGSNPDSMFRLMDPASHRMMGVRADMTPQIERIATTRLANAGRPLRLSYSGQVLRVKGSQIRPDRQFYQAGAELIGSDALAADIEIIRLASESFAAIGITDLSVDLTLPALVPTLCEGLGLDAADAETARRAIGAKDDAALAQFDGAAGKALHSVLHAAGRAENAIAVLKALEIEGISTLVGTLSDLIAALHQQVPDLTLTLDPGEYRGFEYKSGVGFSFFSRGVRGELGRGGRYLLAHPDGQTEPAVGFSVYLDSVMQAVPDSIDDRRVYIPYGTSEADCSRLREEGWRTVYGLSEDEDAAVAAKRLECNQVWQGGALTALG